MARDLLTESGSIFVQIGDENLHLVRSVLDEVFGPQNFVSQIAFQKTTGATAQYLAGAIDYLLWYGRELGATKYRPVYRDKAVGGTGGSAYSWLRRPDGEIVRVSDAPDRKGAKPVTFGDLTSQSLGRQKGEGAASWFPVQFGDRVFRPTMQSRWKTNEAGMARLRIADRLWVVGNTLRYLRYLDDFPAFPLTNAWEDTGIAGFGDPKLYVVQTNTKVIERCLVMTTDPGDLVLDPTCGSGTTAYVAEQWGRRWITIDTSRVALAIARTRLMSARYPYYLLADSPDGRRKEAELAGQAVLAGATEGDIRQGFVYERVPHVTLKSIAQNPDIHEGMSRGEIDAAIARHADTELLYDRPYEDRSIVRVAGPFTVESLSPHRVVADGPEDEPAAAQAPIEESGRYVETILDNLRASGVDNRIKGERLRFETLEPYPGTWLQAEGIYQEGERSKRAAVALGP